MKPRSTLSAAPFVRLAQTAFDGARLVLLAALLAFAAAPAARAQPQTIFENGNIYAVENYPTQPTVFTLSSYTNIASIMTYHWNYARGAWPGTIALRDGAGRIWGPWRAFGRPGQGGVPNAYWVARLRITLPPGTYQVLDSDPSTWSHNAATGGAGIVSVQGYGE